MLKILSIGNSFSQDAHKWLNGVCKSVEKNIYNANLYVPNCSLEMHWNNFLKDSKEYDFEVYGKSQKKISISEALKEEAWDVITFQQVSGLSGKKDSYMPYLKNLSYAVKKECPQAKFYLHQTWAYDKDSTHPPFANYQNNQQKMYSDIVMTCDEIAREMDWSIIPTGTVIQRIRERYPHICLCRDGFHLSWIYGRYAASLVWYAVLFKEDVRKVSFIPEFGEEKVDDKILSEIKETIAFIIESVRIK